MFFLFRFALISDADFSEIKKVCELYNEYIKILYYIPYKDLKTYEIILEDNNIKNNTASIMEKLKQFNRKIKSIIKPHIWNDRIVNYISNFEYNLILDFVENDADDDLERVLIFNKNENEKENVLQVINKEEKEQKEKDTKTLSGLSFRWQMDSECDCDDYINKQVN